MASIRYNNAEIKNAKIVRFNTENEFEGDNFNRTARRHTLEGVGIVGAGTSTTTSLTTVRATLTAPAKKLEIKFDDDAAYVTYADAATEATNYDAANGPLPEITVTEIAGGANSTFLVAFTFRWTECGANPIQRMEMVATHSINEDGLMRISRRGFLKISAGAKGSLASLVAPPGGVTSANPYGNPFNSSVVSSPGGAPRAPDLYRRLVAGYVPNGFQRIKQDYYVQADQTTLAFDIEDQQLYNPIPYPAVNGDGSFEYHRGLDSDIQGTKTLRVELTTIPNGDPADVFAACMDVALTRIRFFPPYPDLIVSFKISEQSLFKRATIVLEIVARGTQSAARFEPTGTTDEWLYKVLFSPPSINPNSTHIDAYGSIGKNTDDVSVSPIIRYNTCESVYSWTWLTGTTIGIEVTTGNAQEVPAPTDIAGSDGEPVTRTDSPPTPDAQLDEDAKSIFSYDAYQELDIETNCNFLVPMGFNAQYGFQFALPDVYIHQTVDIIASRGDVAIPWPETPDGFVVIKNNTKIKNASTGNGNPTYEIRAYRLIRISVYNSESTTIVPGGSGGALAAVPGASMARTVWMPDTIKSPRHPTIGAAAVSIRENKAGEVMRQDYIGGSSGSDEG